MDFEDVQKAVLNAVWMIQEYNFACEMSRVCTGLGKRVDFMGGLGYHIFYENMRGNRASEG